MKKNSKEREEAKGEKEDAEDVGDEAEVDEEETEEEEEEEEEEGGGEDEEKVQEEDQDEKEEEEGDSGDTITEIRHWIENDYKFNVKEGYKPIFETDQYLQNPDKEGKVYFVQPNAIKNYGNGTLQDVCDGKFPFYVTEKDEIKLDDLDLSTLKEEIQKELEKETCRDPIGQGYSNKIGESSRRAWREETTDSSYLKNVIPKFQRTVQAFFKAKEQDYTVSVPSLFRDEGLHPHIQAPHLDFDPNLIRKCRQTTSKRPAVVLYAIEECTIVLFLRQKDTFGAKFGTRIFIPKGCAIIMAGDLYHSGDLYLDSNNLRFHVYCIPRTVSFPLFEIDSTYRDERTDITKVQIHYVTNIGCYFKNEEPMFEELRGMMDIRTTDESDRRELALILYLNLYDFMQLSCTIQSAETEIGSRITLFWVSRVYNLIVDECMKYINSEGAKTCDWIL